MDEPPRDNFNYVSSLFVSAICLILFFTDSIRVKKKSYPRYISKARSVFALRKPKKYLLISCGPC